MQFVKLAFAILLTLAVGCATTAQPRKIERTLPAPLVAADLPPHPKDEIQLPPSNDWAYAYERGNVYEVDGILISEGKARRAALYVTRYEEMRRLYEIDLNTWGREREIYEEHIVLAQDEAEEWRERAKRSWWEKNAGPIGLVTGVLLGIVSASVAAVALDKVQ